MMSPQSKAIEPSLNGKPRRRRITNITKNLIVDRSRVLRESDAVGFVVERETTKALLTKTTKNLIVDRSRVLRESDAVGFVVERKTTKALRHEDHEEFDRRLISRASWIRRSRLRG
jgi:hypothetical protein